ncbi:hypothetical protein [Haloarcula pellucida]|uniref:Uncharacterized protein n=1 Tax=Haloarcula pellucida TaxID=1427151 RepID=A0A830GRA2_9EURY|nr:hypothetical protein [Halomicroarcula pellucida]MBX0350519.1 hypothetical protein [Halomicroarcula pellucida]GGO03707.1 hypothetical protein GCM10009030_39650 [Halomicroarcula pellucida]
MAAADSHQQFILDAVEKDGVDVGRTDEGGITAARDLSDDQIELDDVLELADKHGLDVRNVITDMQSAETRVVFKGGDGA